MSEQAPRKIDAWIMPDGQLRESDEAANERRNKIGTSKIDKKRRADVIDTYNMDGSENHEGWDAYLNEEFVEKEGLSDHDLQEVAAARLDEKMLDVGKSDMDSMKMIKTYDELSRIKSLIQHMRYREDTPLDSAVFNAREDFREKGDRDMADIAEAASDFLHEISLGALDLQGENGGDNVHTETRRVIDDHNDRVASNKKRLSIEEQRHMVSGISTRS